MKLGNQNYWQKIMDTREKLRDVVFSFSIEKLRNFFRAIYSGYMPIEENYDFYIDRDINSELINLIKIGKIEYENGSRLIIIAGETGEELSSRSGKKRQYDLARKVLKEEQYDAGIFIFYDDGGHFRFSLVIAEYFGQKRKFSSFRRYTYFIDPSLPNKTFLNQIGRADFSSIEKIKEAFSIEEVSDEFYREFNPKFEQIAESVQGTDNKSLREDFALLFVIRIIFLGFVQKKGWLGDNPKFIQYFWEEYQKKGTEENTFYRRWLEPLFFEALNNPPGRKVAYRNNEFSKETERALQIAPYLNGELFRPREDVDGQGLWIPDESIGNFLDFIFQYNFTIEENNLYDEELELNPEFLGIIFERIVNKADGAVYTPRVEVDLMCRLALVKWLEENSSANKQDLYELLFREGGAESEFDEMQKQGDFSPAEMRKLISLLNSVAVCDPAAGSGAFEVGMLHVLNEILQNLYERNNTPDELKKQAPSHFERKKAIIANSLYGVEVKRWAVWINHLRLWLTLFIDMPDEFRFSPTPLLPNLQFKVRTGDSLVQRLGSRTFPIHGDVNLPSQIKNKIKKLKNMKKEFFYNQGGNYRLIHQQETQLFREILQTEINEKKRQLRTLWKPKPEQMAFSGMEEAKQMEIDMKAATKRQREQLRNEILKLEEQKKNLIEEHPFIWNIEFAEIFFDKKGFDIIIGNPPYVRQEDITDPKKVMAGSEYKAALQEMVRIDFPRHFAKGTQDAFKKGLKPNGRSDLFTYFYIRSLRLLNKNGIHVFICSNSWLDVNYGAWLQYFLLNNVPMHFIIDKDRKSTRLNSSHTDISRMPSSA